MKEKEPQNESQEALPESEDAVWELLKQAREPKIDPWFVQKVQAAIKQEADSSLPWWKLIFTRPTLGLGVAAAVLALVAVGSWFFRSSTPSSIMTGSAVVVESSADTITLDEEDESFLADIDDDLFWLESSGDVLSSDDASLLDEETVERLLF